MCCERSPIRSSRSSSVLASGFVDANANCLSVVTDRDKLKQILLNLVSNAVKYRTKGRSRSRRGGRRRLRIDVSDTGVGIPAEELGKIFDEFHQADGAISPSRPEPASA